MMRCANYKHLPPSIARSLLAAALCVTLTACSTDMTDLESFVQESKAVKKSPIAPLPEIKPHETFRYEAVHLRNPFEPFVLKRPEPIGTTSSSTGLHPVENRPREALEAFPLDSLRMVGILEQSSITWALIKATDGTIHRIKAGNYMGQNHGKISRIMETQIELMEIVPDGLGNWTERPASLALSE